MSFHSKYILLSSMIICTTIKADYAFHLINTEEIECIVIMKHSPKQRMYLLCHSLKRQMYKAIATLRGLLHDDEFDTKKHASLKDLPSAEARRHYLVGILVQDTTGQDN